MCVIVVKPMGVIMPSDEILEECFKNNSDGAGFMLNHNGRVYGFKGLMTIEAVKEKLAYAANRFGNLDEKSVVLHFRIGTHGTKSPENTHPFPVTNDYAKMKRLEWVASQGMAHNGIIYKMGVHADVKGQDVSDTMVFNKYCCAPMAKYDDLAKSRKFRFILDMIASGKLAFMDGAGKISTCGDFVRDNGILYSNETYKKVRATSYASGCGYWGGHNYYNGYAGRLGGGYYDDEDDDYPGYLAEPHTPAKTAPANDGVQTTFAVGLPGDVREEREKSLAAFEDGLCYLTHDMTVYAPGEDFDGEFVSRGNAYDKFSGSVYWWDNKECTWEPLYISKVICLFDEIDYKYIFISPEIKEKIESGELIDTFCGIKKVPKRADPLVA